MAATRRPLHSFVTPATWPTWIGMGLLRVICWLPHGLALAIGRMLGRLVHLVAGKRRAIVRRNIELCFPQLTDAECDGLTHRHFLALGR